jgi:class 3 adenylate cyclase/tetratricopeptide (TPR) repeat protein
VIVCPSCGEENPERARFCLSCGAGLAEAPVAGGEERKIVSVLFVDLVGFTDRSDRADPEDVRATLRPYHERVKADIERFGGTVEKFIGDAVMAVFGAPVAHEDDAERAVRSGLRILETIEELRSEGLGISVRAAVTTGVSVVALGARPERGEGIVTGDVVNTAARLQSAAPVDTVIVDRATMRSSGSAIAFEPLEAVAAKGKAEPIPVWRATHARSRVGQPEAATHTPFVGREHEQTLLLETFLRAERESSVQLVTVVGEPGIGKSRLVTELRSTLDDRPDLITWRHGRCLPYGEGITFWALGEIVKAEAGILESDDHDEAAGKLEQCVSALVDDASEREWFASRLAPLVGVAGEGGAVGRDESFTAWRRYLEAMAARRPLVVVVEDLHWADEALLDFLEHLLDWAAPVPLLVLSTARPELYDRRPGWSGGKRNATTVSLSPLSADDTARLLQGLLERALLPAETQASLLERAGGNPLYTEQFARMLAERGDLEDIPLPETVQALIAARLDTLPPELKAVLQDASVIGRTFWIGSVAAIGGRNRDEVLGGLRELVRREFVRPARVSSVKGDEEFTIWHALVRDVAYQQIPRAPRAQKHVAAAVWIEEAAQERLADHAEILVHHYERALELFQAAGEERPDLEDVLARFLLLAGDRATHLDMQSAEACYRRAVALSEDDVHARATALARLAFALVERGEAAEGIEAYEEAIDALRPVDEHAAGVAMVGLSRALWQRGESARRHAVDLEAISILERTPGPDLVLAYGRRAMTESIAGRPEESTKWAEKGFALADEIGFENRVRLLQARGSVRGYRGDPGSVDDLRAGLELGLALGLGLEAGIAYNNLGEATSYFLGLAAARQIFDEGIEFSRQRGLAHNVMWMRGERLRCLYHAGEWDDVVRDCDDLLTWDAERGGGQIEVFARVYLADVLTHRGSAVDAKRHVDSAFPRARETEDPQMLVPTLVAAAVVSSALGDTTSALGFVTELERVTRGIPTSFRALCLTWPVRIAVGAGDLDLAKAFFDGSEHGSRLAELARLTGSATVAEAQGDSEEAARVYARAAEGWGEFGSVVERGYALLGLGRLGDTAALHEGHAIFARLGASPVVARAA